MRRFHLIRDEDTTGISGTGYVAEGVEWADGTCAMRWTTEYRSTAVYNSIGDVEVIHGHEGRTRIVWADEDLAGQAGATHYFSTYCIHDLHESCRDSCKFCPETCRCDCHEEP